MSQNPATCNRALNGRRTRSAVGVAVQDTEDRESVAARVGEADVPVANAKAEPGRANVLKLLMLPALVSAGHREQEACDRG